MKTFLLPATAFLSVSSFALVAADGKADKKAAPKPSGELLATEWAGESLLGSPVAISMDNQGRAYVVQTVRRRESELDIRSHTDWVPQVLAFESVEDRATFYRNELSAERSAANKKWLADRNGDGVHDIRDLGVLSELVLRIEDKSGSGVADSRTVFADGLNSEMTGVAAGVMAFNGSVYMTAIPSLWKFDETRRPGPADAKREELITGFGVHVAYSGHDMHGLTVGHDGRIYWSIGDKGLNVALPGGGRAKAAHEGAVVRCEPDGTNFEIFAKGLRNPQEIAFDQWGNLFSVDNDGDFKGERERFVYITEQSDSGWRCNWQYRKGDYNPWMDEKLAVPAWRGQAAYITPPLSNYVDGPCGFVFNPGTALGEKYRNTFFLTQFPGRKMTAFRGEPDGASFKMTDERVVFSGPMMTGLSWGPDGALYVADWNSPAWEPHAKGKIWKLDSPERDPSREETRTLLSTGMAKRDVAELKTLLGHADRRVRLDAQFELVKRSELAALSASAKSGGSLLARVHAIWGLGQLGRKKAAVADSLVPLLADTEPEVRAQSAAVLGDVGIKSAADAVAKLLSDSSPRVRFHAGVALGKIGAPRHVSPIVAMLEKNSGADVYLRHAGITALAGAASSDAAQLAALSSAGNEDVRLSAVVALRRIGSAEVAKFLGDSSPLVVAEAARAIHDDYSIEGALPALASALDSANADPVFARRAISANLRVGGAAAAARLVQFAGKQNVPSELRMEALVSLSQWTNPVSLDRVEGRHRPLAPRPAAEIHTALEGPLAALLADGDAAVRATVCRLVASVRFEKAGAAVFALVADSAQPSAVRRAALLALGELKDASLVDATKLGLASNDAALRADALKLFAASGKAGADAVPLLENVLKNGKPAEQQDALATLAGIKSPAANTLIAKWMDQLANGKVPAPVALDVLDAARASGSSELLEKVAAFEKSRPPGDALAPFREALVGGNASRGRKLAMEHLAAQCTRCHKLGGEGAEVGPDLAKVAARLSREKLLESIIAPSAEIAEGYGIIVVTLADGSSVSGTVAKESASELVIKALDGAKTVIAKPKIKERTEPVSSMPPMGAMLTPREVRDIVEYLATLK